MGGDPTPPPHPSHRHHQCLRRAKLAMLGVVSVLVQELLHGVVRLCCPSATIVWFSLNEYERGRGLIL